MASWTRSRLSVCSIPWKRQRSTTCSTMNFGWAPEIGFEELVALMCAHDKLEALAEQAAEAARGIGELLRPPR